MVVVVLILLLLLVNDVVVDDDDDILLIFVYCSFCLRLSNAFFRSRFINSLKSSDVMVAFGFQLSRY